MKKKFRFFCQITSFYWHFKMRNFAPNSPRKKVSHKIFCFRENAKVPAYVVMNDKHLLNLEYDFLYRYYLYISPPETNFKGHYAFIAPYSYGIWISLLATIITFAILWPVIWKILLKDNSDNGLNDNLTFQLSFLIFLGLMLQKASPYEPNSIAMKIMLGIIAFISVVKFAAYSANLMSLILKVNVEFPFNSYHSFYHDSNYEFGFINGTSFDELFQVSVEILI